MYIERRAQYRQGVKPGRSAWNSESGQAGIVMLLVLSSLLLGAAGFAVDFGNLWFHRQSTQSASDAACQAGTMDLLAVSGGMQLPSMGFTPGTAGDCSASPAATMCSYAKFNGYNGAGPGTSQNSAWNTVSWSFPASVAGSAAPPTNMTATFPYMQITVTENVQTWFLPLFTGSGYQQVSSSCTCGLAQVKEAAPMIVLHPSMAASFAYSGGGSLSIVGGPQRALQVNSTSKTAISWAASAMIDTSRGGANETGSDVGIVGGPSQIPTNGSSAGFNGGTTGAWRSGGLPVPDPYSGLAVPSSIKSLAPITGTAGTWVDYQQDGCPDKRGAHYPKSDECIEFGPGYYPNGITTLDGYSTAIFLPGIYYLNGPLNASGSEYLRNATPCSPSCGPISSQAGLVSHQTDGVMFYFLSGSFNVSGCSGCGTSIDPVSSTALTCDGSPPISSLGMLSALTGNVLWAQCTANGTYWDRAGDTTDSVGSPGSRGILFFQDHGNTVQTTFSGSGGLSFAGSLYFHSLGYFDVLNMSGAAASGTFVIGNIVADQVKLSGSGAINLALNPAPSIYLLKATVFK